MGTIETIDDCEIITTPGSAKLFRSALTQPPLEASPLAQKSAHHSVRAFRRIASASEGLRSEKLLASILAPKPPKRQGNNMTGQLGTEKCIFCVKSKKKCVFDPTAEDDRCRRCQGMRLCCSDKRRPGGDRVLRRMMAAMEKATKQLRLDGPHDFEVLPNDRWEIYQRPYLARTPMRTVTQFAYSSCSNREKQSCYELEGFLRFLIFESKSWRPATDTSTIITLLPKNGLRRRFWVNGTLLGMRDSYGEVREMSLMVERYPRFPTLRSLEEYCWSRILFTDASEEEIRVLAKNIEKRFGILGKIDVREFTLRRKLKVYKRTGNKMMVWMLRWDMEGEREWGCSFWKAYFQEHPGGKVTFIFSRVACHVYLRTWIVNRFPAPWRYDRLLKPKAPQLYHLNITRRALTWLQILNCVVLKKPAVLLSFEDDPITGLPEDISDGIPFEDIRRSFEFGPPEKLHPDGTFAELLQPDWRLLPPEDAVRILWQVAQLTDDPNILPPHLNANPPTHDGQVFVPLYQPRIPPKPSYTTPSMLMITLQEEEAEFPSGFIEDPSRGTSAVAGCPPTVSRSSVAFKSSQTIMDPRDIQRAVNSGHSGLEQLPERQFDSIPEMSNSIDPDAAAKEWAQTMLNLDG